MVLTVVLTQPAHSSSRIDKLGSCLLVQELSNKPSTVSIYYPKVATLSWGVMTWGSCEILWRKPAHFQIPLNWLGSAWLMIPNVKNVPYFRPYSNKPIDLHYLIAASPCLYSMTTVTNQTPDLLFNQTRDLRATGCALIRQKILPMPGLLLHI